MKFSNSTNFEFNTIFIGTQPPLNILVVGNPGAGKSTLLNTILKMKVFKSGVSIGTGMTFDFDLFCNEEDGITYMDTPGLNDISKRQQAADAITTALKHSGQYKVFFVATLEQGRLKPDDITLLQLILNSAPDLTSYGFVFNQVIPNVKRQLGEEKDVLDVLLKGGVPKDRLPTSTIVLSRVDEIDGEHDRYIQDAQDFLQFVKDSRPVVIHPNRVENISTEKFYQIFNMAP